MRIAIIALTVGILIGLAVTGTHYLIAAPASDTAAAMTTLTANTSLISANGDYQLLMTAGGDLVENSLHGISPIIREVNDPYGNAYLGGGNATAADSSDNVTGTLVGSDITQLWHSGTGGHPGARAVVQADGNFVIYSATNAVLWSAGTAGHPGAKLIVRNDANVVLYSGGTALWSTKQVSVINGHGSSSVSLRNCLGWTNPSCGIKQQLHSGSGVTMLCWLSVPPPGWGTPPPSNKWFYVVVDGTQDDLGFVDAGYVDQQIPTPGCIGETKPGQNAPPAPQPVSATPPASSPVTGGASANNSAPQPPSPTANPVPPPPPATFTETVGGPTSTWTNYSDAGGTRGATIPTGQSVQVTCVVQGFRVADGNTNWYRIASSPWNNTYYASADAFYNNGATSGSLIGTPWVDPQVPAC
jgi:hypothetical protein